MLILAHVSTVVPGVLGAVVEGFSFVVADVFSTMPAVVVVVDPVAVVFPSAKQCYQIAMDGEK